MNRLQRLRALEEQVSTSCTNPRLQEELSEWMKEHPISDSRTDPAWNFNEWADSIPSYLKGVFQFQLHLILKKTQAEKPDALSHLK